ncbi:helix-turn-helix transcriptional regulator [Microcoleus sp. N9_A1]|uniref:helix-turn-helix transcriptional regulator n=1 Tax=Microcoleus sp. N9_A1 TaxID=3055380 RepID=UPI002FD494B3
MNTPSQIKLRFSDGDYSGVESESSPQVQHLPRGSQNNSHHHQNPFLNDFQPCESDRPREFQRYVMDVHTREKFAEVIFEMRANRSYRAFSRLLGVTHPTIKAWENLEGIPDLENLQRVAKFRGETLEEFKQILAGARKPSRLQELVQQVRSISDEELAVILHVIAERIAL